METMGLRTVILGLESLGLESLGLESLGLESLGLASLGLMNPAAMMRRLRRNRKMVDLGTAACVRAQAKEAEEETGLGLLYPRASCDRQHRATRTQGQPMGLPHIRLGCLSA